MNVFFKAQVSYCTLVCMCNSRMMNDKINRLHKRNLSDKTSSFCEFISKRCICHHTTKNLQVLVTEMLKVHKNMSTELMQGFFCFRQTHYNLRNLQSFCYSIYKFCLPWFRKHINLRPRIWNLVPDRLKQLNSIDSFKIEIKGWQPEICPCRLCKTYIPRVDFF